MRNSTVVAVAVAVLWAAPAYADETSGADAGAPASADDTPEPSAGTSAPTSPSTETTPSTESPPAVADDHAAPASEPAPQHEEPAPSAPAHTAPTHAPTQTAPTTTTAATPPPEDDGRKLDVLFIQAEGGASYIDLTALSASGRLLPSLTEFRGAGFGAGATVGFRVSVLALAAHGYIARFDGTGENRTVAGDPSTTMPTHAAFDLGQLMLEAQLRIPLPIIEPYMRIGFGYAFMGNFQLNEMYRDSTGSVNGWTGKLGVGADVWLGTMFTVGFGVDFTLLNLRRGGVMREDSACPDTMPTCVELRMDGDAVGVMTHFHLNVGLHF